MKRPKLAPHCFGWKEDLPGPDELPVIVSALGYDTPNHQDNVYLELPRASALLRGVVIWFVPFMIILLAIIVWGQFSAEYAKTIEDWVIFEFITFVLIWAIPFA